jgi:hypothetical protein
METVGIWFRSAKGRALSRFSFLLGMAATFGFVWLDEVWLDFPGWLPFLPSYLSNGWIPLAFILLILIGYLEGLKILDATNCEARQALFTLLLASFITLTLIGIFMRGEGMTLILPWS